jgi:hypothetical protein
LVAYYNADRPHSVFAGRTPDEVYATQANEERLAAQSNPESTLAKPPFCPAKRDHLFNLRLTGPLSAILLVFKNRAEKDEKRRLTLADCR